MVKQKRRQRRSPSSSVDRQIEEPAVADFRDSPLFTSGPRAHESPAEAEIPEDLSAQASPVENTANPRALSSPVVLPFIGQSALQSPAVEEETREDHLVSREGEPAENPINSASKRKGRTTSEDPVAETIKQLRKELRQLRHER